MSKFINKLYTQFKIKHKISFKKVFFLITNSRKHKMVYDYIHRL